MHANDNPPSEDESKGPTLVASVMVSFYSNGNSHIEVNKVNGMHLAFAGALLLQNSVNLSEMKKNIDTQG